MQSFSLPTQYFHNVNGNKISLECHSGKCQQCTIPYGYTNRMCDTVTGITNDIGVMNKILQDDHETKCFEDSNKTFTHICQYCNKKKGADRICTPFFRMHEDIIAEVNSDNGVIPNRPKKDLKLTDKSIKPNTYSILCVEDKCIYCSDDRMKHRTCTQFEPNIESAKKKLKSVEGFGGMGYGRSYGSCGNFWILMIIVLIIAVLLFCDKNNYI